MAFLDEDNHLALICAWSMVRNNHETDAVEQGPDIDQHHLLGRIPRAPAATDYTVVIEDVSLMWTMMTIKTGLRWLPTQVRPKIMM